MSAKQRLVVVGGGMAGHKIVHAMQGVADVTLVDPKDYIEVPMAVPRLLVAPGSLPAIIPYGAFLPKARLVQGWLTEVRKRSIVVSADHRAASTELPYDYLVLATGSNYDGDLVKPVSGGLGERLQHFTSVHKHLESAGRVLIVGGGPVGIELAGEIIESFREKHVTVIEAGPHILPVTSEKPRRWAAEFLQRHGAKLLTGERVVEPAAIPPGNVDARGGQAVTDAGTRIDYDMGFWCVGLKPDASYMNPHFPEALDPRGLIRVSGDFRVSGQRQMFAVGDITNLPDKGAMWARYHADVAIKNLKRLIASSTASTLAQYKRPMPRTTMLVTLGRNNGVIDLPFGTFRAGWLARKLKGEHMLVPRFRKGVGLPPRAIADDGAEPFSAITASR
jgi:NADH dehydrogenase FAD-containing subunit